MFNADTLAHRFPEARYHAEWNLVTWHPTGALTNERADRVIEFLETEEQLEGAMFHRYTDMTGYTRIQIGLDHLVRLARRRKRSYKGPHVKSAFFAIRLLSLNIARMYEELMEGSRIQVCTFRDRDAAAYWLGVPAAILEPEKPTAQESTP